MKRWLMDILACPAKDCRNELELTVYRLTKTEHEEEEVEEIEEALITCPKCNRWYPVIDGIACMLPDENRVNDEVQKKYESAFLKRWEDKIPKDILDNGKPFGLE